MPYNFAPVTRRERGGGWGNNYYPRQPEWGPRNSKENTIPSPGGYTGPGSFTYSKNSGPILQSRPGGFKNSGPIPEGQPRPGGFIPPRNDRPSYSPPPSTGGYDPAPGGFIPPGATSSNNTPAGVPPQTIASVFNPNLNLQPISGGGPTPDSNQQKLNLADFLSGWGRG